MRNGLPSSTRLRTSIRKLEMKGNLQTVHKIALNPTKFLEFVGAENSRVKKKAATFEMGGSSAEEVAFMIM